MSTPQEQPASDDVGLDVLEPDPTQNPRPEEQVADEVRSENPATPQP